MKRFALTIDLDCGSVQTFGDLAGVLDALIDRLKLFAPLQAQAGGGGTLRDDQERVVGSWEIREDP